jgi:hypothetical protein
VGAQPTQPALGGTQRGERKVQPRAVVRRQAQVPKCQRVELQSLQVRQRVGIARRFGHLHAVGQQVLTVQPDSREGAHSGEGFALGAFILMVGEDVVDSTGVDVDLRPEVLGAHGRALDVPAGKAWSPRAGPHQLGPTGLGCLPQGKVAWVVFHRVGLGTDALAEALAGRGAAQLTVAFKTVDAEVDVAGALVGVTARDQRLGDLHHARDMLGGAREDVGGQDVQAPFIVQKLVRIASSDLARRDAGVQRLGDDLVFASVEQLLAHMADVGDVLDVSHVVTMR